MSNGSVLLVRESSPVIYKMKPKIDAVLPIIDEHMDDDKARETIAKLKATGRYTAEHIK
tara:strand:+ start:11940 stop:12116 length:177 start_codon:yes stop_codon:yes gene_type:complete